MANGMGARDWVMDGNEPRSEAEAAALRKINALREKPITARQLECFWSFPGTDCRLRLDVDFDQYGVPSINDVLDASGERFPVEDVWFKGKPLEDVLIEYLTSTPAEELRRV